MNKVLSIVIPAFNEAQSIETLLLKIPEFSRFNLKIFLIDDGSTDNTPELARNLGATVKSNSKNLGLGRTFKIGLYHALKEGSDVIVILDGDGQYNPRDINQLINPIVLNKADFVIANRFLGNYTPEMSIKKMYANKIVSIFISNVLLKSNETYDVQSSFRAFNTKFGKFLYEKLGGKYNYAQEMFIIATLYGYKIKQIPIKCYNRAYGKSKLIKSPIVYLIKILYVTFKTYFKIRIYR
ncbi:MAG: glycosyltransferase family 2 protein [Candidatus Thorarchaeota archaeon]